MNAVYLTNATKLTLEPGPINIFEGSTSVGEGLIRQSLHPSMKDMIPYAIESGCLIESSRTDQAKKAHKASIVNGVMVLKRYDVYENTYRCANKTTKNFTLYLDQPRWIDASLMEPAKFEEELPGYYRFKFDLPANKITEFKVVQRKEISSSINIQTLTSNKDDIKFYLKEPYLTKTMKDFLGELIKLMADINEQQRIVNEAKQEMEKLAKDQERYRENMKILNVNNPKESEKRSEYLERLTAVEKRMETLEQNTREANDKIRQILSQLAQKIQSYIEE
jgi:chaperonin cofactor prefoldin